MKNLPWKDAIVEVLKETSEPRHYAAIADRIAELELRTDFGATPASTQPLPAKGHGWNLPYVYKTPEIPDRNGC